MKKLLFVCLFVGGLFGGNAQTYWKTTGNKICIPPPPAASAQPVIGTATPGGMSFCSYGEHLNFNIIRAGETMIRFESTGIIGGGGTTLIEIAPLSSTKVLIGDSQTVTTPGDYKLYVDEGILTEKVKVAWSHDTEWFDHVFYEEYDLMPLEELEKFIDQYGHLPNIPSAKELKENGGIDLGAMQGRQMAKIEELTLHLIEKDKEIKELQKQVALLAQQVELLLKKQ